MSDRTAAANMMLTIAVVMAGIANLDIFPISNGITDVSQSAMSM